MEANDGWAGSSRNKMEEGILTTEIEKLKAELKEQIEKLKVENYNLKAELTSKLKADRKKLREEYVEKDKNIENLKVENDNLKAELTSTLPLIEDTFNSLADKLTHSLTHSLESSLSSPTEEYDEGKMYE